jgi:hypothetical protein
MSLYFPVFSRWMYGLPFYMRKKRSNKAIGDKTDAWRRLACFQTLRNRPPRLLNGGKAVGSGPTLARSGHFPRTRTGLAAFTSFDVSPGLSVIPQEKWQLILPRLLLIKWGAVESKRVSRCGQSMVVQAS